MPQPVTIPPRPPAKKITFKRAGQPVIEEPPAKPGPKKAITPLEQSILQRTGGKLEVLEAPDHPLPEQEAIEFQAQKLAQVEHLMFQGIRTPHLIAQAVGVKEHVAARYVKAVLARWQTVGSDVDLKTQRGEAIGYMNFLQNQLWTQFTAAKKVVDEQMKLPADKRDGRALSSNRSLMLNLNNQIIALNSQRNQLYGLTPQAIQQMLVLGGNEDHEVLVRMRKQQGMKEIAAKLGAILLRNRANAAQDAQFTQLPTT